MWERSGVADFRVRVARDRGLQGVWKSGERKTKGREVRRGVRSRGGRERDNMDRVVRVSF